MFKAMMTGARFFLLGLVVGLLTAPRSGRASRRMMARKINSVLSVAPQEMMTPVDETANRIQGSFEEMKSQPSQNPPGY